MATKYVCITDFAEMQALRRSLSFEVFPTLGEIYTIRSVETFSGWKGYLLNEIINPPYDYRGGKRELFFGEEHFRPVTDISALQKLTKVRELEDVR